MQGHACRWRWLPGLLALVWLVPPAAAQNPSIASFDPWHGNPGVVVTIVGSNLTGASEVRFNNKVASALQAVNASMVKATVPAGASTGKIKITTPAGSYTTSSDFIVDGNSGGEGSSGDPGGFIAPPPIEPPAGSLTGHPRLFVRAGDLPRLRSWANASNPVWVALAQLAASAKKTMDEGKIVDNGNGGGNVTAPTESYAELFAFLSLVHPDPAARSDYANRAYALIRKPLYEAAKGLADGQPFRGREFAINNRASWYGESFPLTVDWIYHKLTAADKAAVRTVFLRWIQENLRANTTSQEHPQPLGLINDPALVDTAKKLRWATNNYYTNHARHVGLLSMALDAADDIPSLPTDPPAGTLRRFVGNAIGAWLYVMHEFEKTQGAGGISPEGVGYGALGMRGVAFLLLAMHTAGVDKPQIYGPAADAINSPFWQQEALDGYLHLLSPAQTIQESWIGPTFLPYTFADDEYYRNADYVRVLGPLAVYALNTGNAAQYAKLRWMIDNLPPGGVGSRAMKIVTAFNSSSISLPILYYLATDPTFGTPPDPRPSLPTTHFAPGLGLLLTRTGWAPSASWFTYKLGWNTIDHQFCDGNGIGFYRGGEWLTKNHAGYGSNIGSSDYQNTLAIQNPASTGITFWQINALRGSQWAYSSAGDPPPPLTHVGASYAYAQGDATNLYNNPRIGAADVLHASRSVLFLKPDTVVVYDRATTQTAGRFKRFHLNTPAPASLQGRTATVLTPGGQKLSIDVLLPANAALTSVPQEIIPGEMAQYEPMTHRFWSEDPNGPADVRFLHVLHGTGALLPKVGTARLPDVTGTPFDGALVGTVAVLFRRFLDKPFKAVTFKVPAGTARCYITGLNPQGAYSATLRSGGGQVEVTIRPGGALLADKGGVLIL